jgi:hypothetical protein
LLVLTLKVPFGYVPAAGFVMPMIKTVAAVLFASAHVPPLLASLMFTVDPELDPVPAQFEKLGPSVTDGDAGIAKAELKVTVIVSPEASAPCPLVWKPTVHVAVVLAVCGFPEKVTVLTPLAATYIGVAPGVGVATTVGVGSGATGAPRALATSMRPKDWPEARESVAPSTWSRAEVLLLPEATNKAASPATMAAEAEVPLIVV